MSQPGPREVFARLQEYLLASAPDLVADVWAEDVVVETPFAPPGRPRRVHGREDLLALGRVGPPCRCGSRRSATWSSMKPPTRK